MNEKNVLAKIRTLTWFFIIGLVLSGVTAIPLQWEVDLLAQMFGAAEHTDSQLMVWLLKVRDALHDTGARFPFLFYGTDWLAFGHVMIALVFVGALRDPVKNVWLFDFGLIACVLVIPWAFAFGAVRGIPVFWRLIDCSFGVFGVVPLWYARKWVRRIEQGRGQTNRGLV
ncbi:MAG: hypothetical protein JWM68_4092 [Verrucomicrobiales bacterium]|nr:hypothetical protein [Verrucomicrobiales bacterium]